LVTVTPEVRQAPAAPSVRRGRRRSGERIIETLLIVAAAISIAATVGIVLSLALPTAEFFREVSVVRFFTETRWTPLFADKNYGVWPLVVTTVQLSLIALVIAIPLGIGSAIYLAEYAKPRTRKALKPLLEILAGIPTVVYGFFALAALNPILQDLWPGANGPDFQNLISAGVVMGIMIVPTIASLSEDAMTAVPRSLREGAYALASSKMQVATRVVVPGALSGIVAAIVLGTSRALGETMIATIAAGIKADVIEWNPLRPAASMTAYIAGAGQGDLPVESLEYLTIFAVGAVLFVLTFFLNALSIRLVRRFREVYE
jgi:phosphate transport system permease protein